MYFATNHSETAYGRISAVESKNIALTMAAITH